MRWIALALLASLAAAIWWFDAPWPARSAQWDQRYAEAAGREDCDDQLALIRVGVEADYPPAVAALGELAERNACGYRAGQFDYEESDNYPTRMVHRNRIERALADYAFSADQQRHDLNNGWLLRNRVMAWLDARATSPDASPHAALLHIAEACSDQLMVYSYSPHWAALEASLQANPLDPHWTAAERYRRRLACREVLYQASIPLRAADNRSLREFGRSMHSQAADWGQPQAISDCLDFSPPPARAWREPGFEAALYCPRHETRVPRWVVLGYPAARTAWLDSLDPGDWADDFDSWHSNATPVWVAIHATIGHHPIRETALSFLPPECAQIVNEVAARVERLQTAQSPLAGIRYDEDVLQAWHCEPASLQAHGAFDTYYVEEGFPLSVERWSSAFAPAAPDGPETAH